MLLQLGSRRRPSPVPRKKESRFDPPRAGIHDLESMQKGNIQLSALQLFVNIALRVPILVSFYYIVLFLLVLVV